MPSLSVLKKNIAHYNSMFMNFRQKETETNNMANEAGDLDKEKKGKIRLTSTDGLEGKGNLEDYGKSAYDKTFRHTDPEVDSFFRGKNGPIDTRSAK